MISPFELQYCYLKQGFFNLIDKGLLSEVSAFLLMYERINKIIEEDFVNEVDLK